VDGGQLRCDLGQEPVVLGMHGGGIDLVEHAVQQRLDPMRSSVVTSSVVSTMGEG